MKPSKLEQAILNRIALESDDEALSSQILVANITQRKHTGIGCYSKISKPENVNSSEASYALRGPINGPDFESSNLEHSGGSLLWFTDGFATELEMFSYNDEFPEDDSELTSYTLKKNKVDIQ